MTTTDDEARVTDEAGGKFAACWYCDEPSMERKSDPEGRERDVCEVCADDLRRGDELDRWYAEWRER